MNDNELGTLSGDMWGEDWGCTCTKEEELDSGGGYIWGEGLGRYLTLKKSVELGTYIRWVHMRVGLGAYLILKEAGGGYI